MKRIVLCLCFVCASFAMSFGQSVVAGSDFSQKEKYIDASSEWRGWDFSTINKYGAESATTFSSVYNYVEDGDDIQKGKAGWIIVPNPFQLGTNKQNESSLYPDIEDDMYVSPIVGKSGNNSLFSITVGGLKPGSSYSVTLKYYLLYTSDPTHYSSISFRFGIVDDYGNMNGCTESGQIPGSAVGVEKSLVYSGTLAADQTSATITLNLGYNFDSKAVFGISDVQVTGTINPFVVSGQGKEMCRGEQTLLSLDRDYGENAVIKWERSANGSSWTNVSNKTSLYDEVTAAKMYYRATVNGVQTPSLEVTTVTCCETVVDGNTVYSSRETVYFEDFGHFTDEHEYVSTDGTVSTTPSNWIIHRNNCPFSMPSGAGSYDATGQVNDGSYAVVVPTSQGYKTDYWATWMTGNGAITQDHSSMIDGVQNSACLFMNVGFGFTGNIFEHEISGLCTGKKLTFECYVGNMSDGTSPIISLFIKNKSGVVLGKVENFSPGKGAGWQRVVIDDLILTEENIVFEIYSGSDGSSGDSFWRNGCDLCIDDIKIMACSSPALDLFSDVNNLERSTNVCSDPFTLGSVASNLLSSYYGSNLQYVFQYTRTPDDESSWVQIGSPSKNSTYTIANPKESPIFSGVKSGESVFFRVVAATASTLANTSEFSQTNYCKNYSISPSVEAIMDCPTCTEPKPLTITPSGKTALCPNEKVSFTVTSQDDASSFNYTWYKGDEVLATQTAATLPLNNIEEAGTYKVLVKDVKFPTLTSCQKTAEIEVTSLPYPSMSIGTGGEYCEGDEISDIGLTFIGTAPFTYTYSENGGTAKNGSSQSISGKITPSSTVASGEVSSEYVYTIKSLKDANCVAPASNYGGSAKVVVGKVPTVAITSVPESGKVCSPATVALSGSSDISDATFSWSGSGSGTAASLTASTSGDYSVTATNMVTATLSCESTPATKAVSIESKPVVTLSADKTTVCSDETISVTATAKINGQTVSDGTFAWLGATGSGATATVVKTAAWPSEEDVSVTVDYESSAGCKADRPDALSLVFNPYPNAPTEANQKSWCMNASAANKTLEATADGNCTLSWYDANGTKLNAAPSFSIQTDNVFNYSVSQTYKGCESERTPIEIVVNKKLRPEIIISSSELCEGTTTDVTVEKANQYDVTWSGTAATSGFGSTINSSTPTFTAPAANGDVKEYVVHVYVENAECDGESEATITVYPNPTVTLSEPDAVCSGVSATVTATINSKPSDGGTYVWSSNVSGTTETSAVYGETSSGTVTYDFTSAKGCKAKRVSRDVTVKPIPSAPATTGFSKCLDAVSESLDNYVTKASGAVLNWYGTDATGGTASSTAPTPSTANSTNGTNYYVSQSVDGCESERSSVTVTVLDELLPTIVLSNDEVCEGTAVNVSLADSYETVEWSGSAANEFNSTSTATPVFKNTAAANDYTVNVRVVDINGCEGTGTATIVVNPKPTAELHSDNPNNCISETTAQTISATITPDMDGTGSWTVATKTSEKTATFKPSDFAAGTQKVTYNFESEKGCKADETSINMVVYPLPTPTLTVSNRDVCVSGNNSAVVTMSTTGTSNPDGFAYTIDNGGSIDDKTGAFDPTQNAANKEYTVTLTYTDENGCVKSTSDKIFVHSLPTVEINAPTEICYNGAAATITADVNPTGGSGVWTGTASSTDQSFDPATKLSGVNDIKYVYTDVFKCQNEKTVQTNVVKVDAPTVGPTQTVLITGGQASGSDVLTATASEAGDVIQWLEDETGGDVIETGTSYSKGADETTPVGSYKFAVREYRMVNNKECYSDSTIATLVVSACEALAPVASDIYVCRSEGNVTKTLKAERNGNSTISDSHISWLDADPVGENGSDFDSHVKSGVGADVTEYEVTNPASAIQDFVYYAAEYDEINNCWSAGTKVTVHVVDTPSVTIASPKDICAYGDQAVPVTVNPHTGTLTASEGTVSGFSWIPGDYNTNSDKLTTTLTYVVESSPYNDGTTCTSTVKSTTTAHFMEAPKANPKTWLIGDIEHLPNLTGEFTSTGEKMTWYANAAMSSKLQEASLSVEYAADTVALRMETVGLTSYTKSYWITQTDGNGCESKPSEVVLSLVDCPWSAPAPDDVVRCSSESLPDITVSASGNVETMAVGGKATKWLWYSAENQSTPLETQTVNDNSSRYAHGVGNVVTENTTTTFFVSYMAVESSSGQECESPKAKVTVTVNALPEITVDDVLMCYAQGKTIVSATVNGTSSTMITSGGEWTLDGETTNIAVSTGEIDPTFGGQADGNYTIQYTYTDANGCTNSDDATLVVEYPDVPSTDTYIGMTSNPIPVVLTAKDIEDDASAVSWFRTETSRNELSGNANPWTVDASIINPAEQTGAEGMSLYVSQTVNGCVSERAEQKISIVDCPWTVETVTDAETCEGVVFAEGMVATANSGADPTEWSWSTTAELNSIAGMSGTSSTFTQNNIDEPGTTTYFVRYKAYYEAGRQSCWSEPREIRSTVYSNPTVSFEASDPTSVCHSSGDVRIRVRAVAGNNGGDVENTLEETLWTTTGVDGSFATTTESYAYFSASKQDSKTDIYSIAYKAVDNKGCVGTAERQLRVIYLPKPETEGFYAMTSQKNDVVVKVTSAVESGASIHWFDYESGMSPDVRKNKTDNGDGTTWNTGLPYDRETERTYYARQYDGSAECYSEATEAVVRLVPCPIPNVIIDAPVACVYDVASGAATLTAATGTTDSWNERDGSLSQFRFYASVDATDFAVGDESGKFDPKNSVATANVYPYYVSEYNSLPLQGLTNPEGCEGRKVKTTVTIIETQAPIITPADNAVCEGETDKLSFKATYNGMGTGAVWFEEDPGAYGIPSIDGSPVQMTFNPTGDEPNDYTIYAVRFENDCYSEKASATYTIKPIPTAPEVFGSETCEGTDTVISARGADGAVLSWYSDASGKTFLGKGSTYLPKVSDVAEYTYYVAQTVDGCQGPLAPVVYEIKMIPNAPSFKNPGNLCEYDAAPTLVAEPREGMTVKWYVADELIADGEELMLSQSDMTAGAKRYSVTQTLRSCESDKANVIFNVYSKPNSPRVSGASVCEGDTLIPTLATDFATDAWYNDADAQVLVAKGYTYTPDVSEVGNKDVIYYVVREQRGCFSDTIPDTLHVIARPTFTIGEDTVLCIYDSVLTIQARNYVPAITDLSFIEWSVSNGTQSKKYADNEEHSVTPTNMITAVGDYVISARYVYRSDVATCRSDVEEMTYSVKARARKPLVFSTLICQGEDIDELRSLGSPNTVWNSLDGTLPDVWHGQSYRFQPGQRLDTGSYRFEIYDMNMYSIDEEDESNSLGCESVRDTITLVVAPGANTKLFGRDSVCMGSIGEPYYTQFAENSQYFWTVTGDNLNYSKDATATSVRHIDWLSAGVDTIFVYEQTWAGCEGFDTLIVQIAPAPEAHFTWSMPGSTNVIELKDSTIQDSLWTTDKEGQPVALPIEYTMAWNFGHQGTDESYVDTVIPYNQRNFPIYEGGYLYGYNCPILTVTNDFGCTSTYTECIFVNLSSSLYVPTAFSPSNPAHAVRTFQPKGFNLATCEISVYDKWGNLMWFSNEVKDGMFVGYWDGRYEGKMAKADVYIWKMEATFLDGQVWQGFDAGNGKMVKYGSVMLLR